MLRVQVMHLDLLTGKLFSNKFNLKLLIARSNIYGNMNLDVMSFYQMKTDVYW